MTEQKKLAHQIIRFGGIGVLATLTHFLVLTLSVEALRLVPTFANGIAFCVAVFVTYFGQSYLVFDNKEHSLVKSTKFLSSAFLGLGLNMTIMFVTTNFLEWSYILGFFLSTIIVPAVTFVVNKFWVFKSVETNQQQH